MKRTKAICTIFLMLAGLSTTAQDDKAGRISPKELTIPASPVFDLMGVAPSQITRTSDIKDFKVDWSFKSYRLNPNLAIQSQPIWELLYNRKELTKYQDASPVMRTISSLDVSFGSVQDENTDRRIGGAIKLNLFKERDPLMARELYVDIINRYKAEKTELEKQLVELKSQLDTTTDILQKPALRNQLKSVEEQLLSQHGLQKEEINSRVKVFVEEYWNSSSLDIAVGRIYTFQSDSIGSLKKKRLNRNSGLGVWLNGGFGIGKKILVTGLVRTTFYDEQVDFIIRNTATDEETKANTIAKNHIATVGLNLRYGGPIYTFFTEFIYERRGLKSPMDALNKNFKIQGADQEIVESSVKWTALQPYTFSLGGDWRISRNLIINYGMRCLLDEDLKFDLFVPVVTISCMMR